MLLSHGRENELIAVDGKGIELERIFEKFNDINCPLLAGKPKFFIIQACRGDRTDRIFPGSRSASGFSTSGSDTAPKDGLSNGEYNSSRPNWEDMVIAYSTIPGFTSQRDLQNGTWFIQCLVKVFKRHFSEKELLELLKITQRELSKCTDSNGVKQTLEIVLRGVSKNLYFESEKPPIKPSNNVQESEPTPIRKKRALEEHF